MFRIGQFGALGGVTAKTLRHYDALGLFVPAWVDPATGYRWYTAAQLPELRRIVALRDLGVPLAEVAELVEGGEDLRAVLRRRRRDLEAQRLELERTLAALDITVAMPESGPDVVVRTIAVERVATLRRTLQPDVGLDVMFDEVEAAARDSGKRAGRPPGSIVHHAYRDGRWDVEVWVPVTGTVAAGSVTTRRLPGTRAATALHRGDYGEMHRTRDRLLEWIVGSRLVVTGPERFVYLQFGADPALGIPGPFLAGRSEELLTEIQIPV